MMTDEEIYIIEQHHWTGLCTFDAQGFARAIEAAARRDALVQIRAAIADNAAPDGYEIVAVKGLSDLVYAMERAEQKGNLPYDFEAPWESFDYQSLDAAPQPSKESDDAN